MNLVNELQVSAEQDDVLVVLRKARRLASKLGVDDINQWLLWEQEGYPTDSVLPDYRIVSGNVIYDTNGIVPAGYGQLMDGTFTYPSQKSFNHNLRTGMRQIDAIIKMREGPDSGCTVNITDAKVLEWLRNGMNPRHADQITFRLKLNMTQIQAVPEAVKDKILDWALELEQRGILGDGITFNDKEKAEAHNITFNISNSQIEQLNNMGQNLRRNDG